MGWGLDVSVYLSVSVVSCSLTVFSSYQLWRIVYYGHRVQSLYTGFLLLCFLWSLVRCVYYGFGFPFSMGQRANLLMYWLPLDLEFAAYSLILVYCAFRLIRVHKHRVSLDLLTDRLNALTALNSSKSAMKARKSDKSPVLRTVRSLPTALAWADGSTFTGFSTIDHSSVEQTEREDRTTQSTGSHQSHSLLFFPERTRITHQSSATQLMSNDEFRGDGQSRQWWWPVCFNCFARSGGGRGSGGSQYSSNMDVTNDELETAHPFEAVPQSPLAQSHCRCCFPCSSAESCSKGANLAPPSRWCVIAVYTVITLCTLIFSLTLCFVFCGLPFGLTASNDHDGGSVSDGDGEGSDPSKGARPISSANLSNVDGWEYDESVESSIFGFEADSSLVHRFFRGAAAENESGSARSFHALLSNRHRCPSDGHSQSLVLQIHFIFYGVVYSALIATYMALVWKLWSLSPTRLRKTLSNRHVNGLLSRGPSATSDAAVTSTQHSSRQRRSPLFGGSEPLTMVGFQRQSVQPSHSGNLPRFLNVPDTAPSPAIGSDAPPAIASGLLRDRLNTHDSLGGVLVIDGGGGSDFNYHSLTSAHTDDAAAMNESVSNPPQNSSSIAVPTGNVNLIRQQRNERAVMQTRQLIAENMASMQQSLEESMIPNTGSVSAIQGSPHQWSHNTHRSGVESVGSSPKSGYQSYSSHDDNYVTGVNVDLRDEQHFVLQRQEIHRYYGNIDDAYSGGVEMLTGRKFVAAALMILLSRVLYYFMLSNEDYLKFVSPRSKDDTSSYVFLADFILWEWLPTMTILWMFRSIPSTDLRCPLFSSFHYCCCCCVSMSQQHSGFNHHNPLLLHNHPSSKHRGISPASSSSTLDGGRSNPSSRRSGLNHYGPNSSRFKTGLFDESVREDSSTAINDFSSPYAYRYYPSQVEEESRTYSETGDESALLHDYIDVQVLPPFMTGSPADSFLNRGRRGTNNSNPLDLDLGGAELPPCTSLVRHSSSAASVASVTSLMSNHSAANLDLTRLSSSAVVASLRTRGLSSNSRGRASSANGSPIHPG